MIFRDIKRFFTLTGVIFLFTFFIIGGCDKDNNTAVNFTIDITQAQFSQLQTLGGSVVYNGIIIAHSPVSGNYIAVSAYCTVDNDVLSYNGSYDYFVCPLNHEYNEQGKAINSSAASLISYHTNLVNNLLQIYS
jgi:hypothetical protein